MEEHYLAERGISYRTNIFATDRKTLVFIHGISGSASTWEPYERAFAERYNIVTFDLRGHGKSKKYKKQQEYSLDLLAGDLYKLLKHLKIKRATIVTHSFGALVALTFTARHRDMVDSVIYVSPAYSTSTLFPFFPALVHTWIYSLSLFPFNPTHRARNNYSQYRGTGDWNVRRIFTDLRLVTVRIYLYCLQHTYEITDAHWKDTKVPTYIIHGDKDTVVPLTHAKQLSKLIKAPLYVIKGADHIVALNHIAQLSERIRKIIDKTYA